MPDSATDLQRVLADRYRLERELGRGGTATVYLAHDLAHDRAVALKVLRPELGAAVAHERFLREVRIAAALAHPNIVSLLDSGQAEGTLFYTMPFVDGGSLRARLERERELPVAECQRIVTDVLAALRHAHAAGIVHRDIKPENILFMGGRAMVADFGIAKAIAHASTPRLTETGIAVGTPAYMAPEQASADPHADHRVDLYALGAVWYEMLVGGPLFAGLSPQQQIAAHIVRVPDAPSHVRPAVPRAVSDLVMRCLEKRPADRWQSAEELEQMVSIAGVAAGGVTAAHADAVPSLQSFAIDDALCRQLSPDGFDPRMVGDALRYLDNHHVSDTLVVYLTRWCIDPEDGEAFLRHTPYRAVAPALFGFDAAHRYRVTLPIDDHVVLLAGMIRALTSSTGARHVVLVGFSTGGDLALRLAATDPGIHGARIDGALALGSNLAAETAFLSAELARADTGRDDALLPFLRRISERASSLQDWLDVNEYLVRLVRRFRTEMPVLRTFAEGIAGPFDAARLAPFVRWYRDATRMGRQLRCVFEDNAVYRRLVRELQVGQRDGALLGDHFQDGSLLIEPGTGHFDLEAPPLIERHLDVLVQGLRDRRG